MRKARFISLFLAVLGGLAGTIAAQPAPAGPELPRPGQTLEEALHPGDSREYSFEVGRGEVVRILLDRRGGGLSAQVVDEADRVVRDSSSKLGRVGPEELSVLGTSPKHMRLAVTADKINRRASRYLISAARGRAGPSDRTRDRAERAVRAADQLTVELSSAAAPAAFRKYSEALRLYRAIHDYAGEGWVLLRTGNLLSFQGEFARAVDCYKRAAAMARSIGNPYLEASTLGKLSYAYMSWRRYAETKETVTEAVTIFRRLGEPEGVADALNTIGMALTNEGNPDLASAKLHEALTLAREAGDVGVEEWITENLGVVAENIGDTTEAKDCYLIALSLAVESGNALDQANPLQNLSNVYQREGDIPASIDVLTRSLVLLKASEDPLMTGRAYERMGVAYNNISQYDLAIDFYDRALALLHDRDPYWESSTLNASGLAHYYRGEYRAALDLYTRALEIQHSHSGEPIVESGTLISLGRLYAAMGDYPSALDRFREAGRIATRAQIRDREGIVLFYSGTVYRELGKSAEALELFDRAIAIYKQQRMDTWVADALDGIGGTKADNGDFAGALESFEQALHLARTDGAVRLEAEALAGAARARIGLGSPREALVPLQQSLDLFRQIQFPIGEAVAWSELMAAFRALERPEMAIVCGKEAVNGYQAIRRGLRAIGKNAPLSFLRSKEPTYRELADLLIREGRLLEAQRVLDMLKEEEYLQFVRRDLRESVSLNSQIEASESESELGRRYRGAAEGVVSIGRERGALAAKAHLEPDEERRLSELDGQLDAAEKQFQTFLDQIAGEARAAKLSQARASELTESQGLMEDLRDLGPGTVAIYTLLTDDRYRVILITPDVQVARETVIDRETLNREVARFRELLQNPALDPVPSARRLYEVLVAPIAADLDAAGAQTVMWSLDGVLRYVPIAALYDGKQFLAERYRTVLFTPASHARLKDSPHREWAGLGLGVSRARGAFSALPGVREELRSIFGSSIAGKATGVLPGRILLDENFTKASMRQALRERRPVVHIASHFQFLPGDETKSFLLLGNGERLSLGEIKNTVNLFSGVELLALSACNTAVGGPGADGREVEGFGVLAQRQGAKAIVATLWSVSDESSTRLLMHRFYQLRAANPELGKAEALRRAQVELLRGELADAKGPSSGPKFSHPFFWAAFVLIGNWK